MATRQVAVLDPHTSQPLKGIVVEAHDASDGFFISTARTNDQGIASFSLTVAATFHARTANTPPLYQIVLPDDQGAGPFWFNYLVDPAWAAIVASGAGSEGQSFTAFHGHTFNVYSTLEGATAAAITSASTNGQKTILVVSSITAPQARIDIGGLGDGATIIITSADRYAVVITGSSDGGGKDIFTQDSDGGGNGGRLLFRNIGLAPAGGKAVLDMNTTGELTNLEFEDCHFHQSGSYLARQDGSAGTGHSLGGMQLRLRGCTGALAALYKLETNSATFAPDRLDAFGNYGLTLSDWWLGGPANAAPQFTRIQDGFYTISNGLTLPNAGPDELHFKGLTINYGGGTALITSGSNSGKPAGGDDWAFEDIILRTTHVGSAFLSLGSQSINPHEKVYIQNVFGYSTVSPTGTFIILDSDIIDPYVGDIHAPDWATLYSGPTITPAIPVVVDHDDLTNVTAAQHHTKYLDSEARAAVPYAIEINFGWDPQSPQIFVP